MSGIFEYIDSTKSAMNNSKLSIQNRPRNNKVYL